MKFFFSFLFLIVAFSCAIAENLLPDPNFEHGANGYLVGDGRVFETPSFQVVPGEGGNELRMKLVESKRIALYLPEVRFAPDTEYELSFEARCDRGSLPLIVSEYVTRQDGSHGAFFPTVTPEWKRYTFHFNTDAPPPWKQPRFRADDPERFGGFRIVKNNSFSHEAGELSFRNLYLGPVGGSAVKPNVTGAFAGNQEGKAFYERGEQLELPLELIGRGAAPEAVMIQWKLTSTDKRVIDSGELKRTLSPGREIFMLPLTIPARNGIFTLSARVNGNEFINRLRFAVSPRVRVSPGDLPVDTGVNGTITNQNEAELTRAEIAFLADAGLAFIRTWDNGNPFSWNALEPQRNQFFWTHADRLIENADAVGIEVLPVIGGMFFVYPNYDYRKPHGHAAPEWVYRTGETVPCPASMPQFTRLGRKTILPREEDWRDTVAAIAGRYRGKVHYYEIMNEPNLCLTAEQYMKYLQPAYREIKKADPAATVIGICATGDYDGHIIRYVDQLLELGAAKDLDAISFHPYNNLYEDSPKSGETVLTSYNRFLREKGIPGTPLWNTELYYLNPECSGGSDSLRGPVFHPGYLIRRYLLDASQGVKASILVPGTTFLGNAFNDNFSAERSGGFFSTRLFPSERYIVNAVFADLFKGTRFRRKADYSNGLRVYVFAGAGRVIAAVFTLNGTGDDGKSLVLKTLPPGGRVLDLFGNPLPENGGATSLPLTPIPHYIEVSDEAGLDSFLEQWGKPVQRKLVKTHSVRVDLRGDIDLLTSNNSQNCDALARATWLPDEKMRNRTLIVSSKHPLSTEKFEEFSFEFTPVADGTVTLEFKGPYEKGADGLVAQWVLYDRIRARNATIANGDFDQGRESWFLTGSGEERGEITGQDGDPAVKVWHNAVAVQKIAVKKDMPVTIRFAARLP